MNVVLTFENFSTGVSEGKWKKWHLAMRTLLDNKDGSLLDAVGREKERARARARAWEREKEFVCLSVCVCACLCVMCLCVCVCVWKKMYICI